jgi:hypothetical protein
MADIIDNGNEAAEIFRRAALSKRQADGPAATGECLNCEAPVEPPKRFCDQYCRDDFERRNARR